MATKRYFELSDGTSNKFWEVWCDGVQVFTDDPDHTWWRYSAVGE